MFKHTYRITVVKWECMLDAPDMKSSVYEWNQWIIDISNDKLSDLMHEIQV